MEQKKKKKFHQHDARLVQKLARKKMPTLEQLSYISQFFSKFEKSAARVLSGILIIAVVSLLINVYWNHSELVAKDGGSYTEGLVGAPHYVNPLFAQANDVDLDLTALVFSGLLKFTDQGMVKDLAEDYQISSDQKVYTFQLRKDVKWHDGEAFDADDVIFTFMKISDVNTKTPLYFTFRGSTIEKLDDHSVRFTLTQPFAPFLESLAFGILPEHIWQNIQPENMMLAEYNLKPIGSGPFKFKSLVKNKNGAIKTFKLERNEGYYATVPHIEELIFKFHESFEQAVEALNNKTVEGISYLPKEIRERIINNRNLNFYLLQLPQYTAVFFNYANNAILNDVKIRKILAHAIDKEKIVNEILNAEAQIIYSGILPGSLGYNPDIVKYPYNQQHAKDELEKAGWKLVDYSLDDKKEEVAEEETADKEGAEAASEPAAETEEYAFQVRKKGSAYLEFTLTTVNQAQNVAIAKELQKNWQQIGAKVNLNIVHPNEVQTLIKERNYETILYSQILGLDPDPYPFWHSSFRTYPGLNLTSLQSPIIDSLLDSARKTSDDEQRAEKYKQFQAELAEYVPAIFLFNPTYTYPQTKKIKGFNTQKIINPANRFNQVSDWFIKTDRKWTK